MTRCTRPTWQRKTLMLAFAALVGAQCHLLPAKRALAEDLSGQSEPGIEVQSVVADERPSDLTPARVYYYTDENGAVKAEGKAIDITHKEDAVLQSGTYVVGTDQKCVDFPSRMQCNGTVTLIMTRNANVRFGGGIQVNEGSTLRIYAEERSTPELHAFGADGHAAIGGSDGVSAGTVIARGVSVTASVEGDGAAIGGGRGGAGGTLTFVDCDINATCGWGARGAGIGGGKNGSGGTVSISGKSAYVESGHGAGIGGGFGGSGCDKLTINNVEATVRGGSNCAGIGGGWSRGGGEMAITDSKVTAYGSDGGAGIGGGYVGDGGTITITNSEVNATGAGGAGIGAGGCGRDAKVTISGGHVVARSQNLGLLDKSGCGAGIGVGIDGGGVAEVSILDDATVEASSEGNSVAIGGMLNRNDAHITLYDNARVDAGSRMTSGQRITALRTRRSAEVKPCTHELSICKPTKDGHTIECKLCTAKTFEEPHHFDDQNCTCTKCGAEAPDLAFAGVSHELGKRLGLTFWLDLSQIDAFDYGVREVEISIGGKQRRTVSVPCDEAVRDDQGRLGFTFPITSLEMAEPVTATVRYGKDRVAQKTTSLEEYLVQQNGAFLDEGPDAHHLAHATINVGYYLPRYLAENGNWKLGADYAEMSACHPLRKKVEEARSALAGNKVSYQRRNGAPVGSVSSSMRFGSLATLDVTLSPAKGKSLQDMSATFKGEPCEIERLSDGRLRVSACDIEPTDYDERITIAADDGSFSMETSVLAYLHAAFEADPSQDAEDGLASAYWYYRYAEDYRAAKGL